MIDWDTFISIDTETTGLSFEDDRVIEFGAAFFIKGKCVHRENIYINTPVPNNGFEVNRITDEQIRSGLVPDKAFRTVRALFGARTTNRICIYNAPFDLSFLAHEFRRNGIDYSYSHLQILDPLVIARYFYKHQKNKLVNVCERLGIPLDNAHDAAADAEAAGHVYIGLRNMFATIHPLYLNDTFKNWHNKWAVDFSTWYRGKYGETPSISPWPCEPELMEYTCSPVSELW